MGVIQAKSEMMTRVIPQGRGGIIQKKLATKSRSHHRHTHKTTRWPVMT